MKLLRRSEPAPAITVRRSCGGCADVAAPQDRFCRRCGMVIDRSTPDTPDDDGIFAVYGPSPVHGQ